MQLIVEGVKKPGFSDVGRRKIAYRRQMAVYHIRADAVDQRLEPPQPDKIADRGWELFPLQPLAAIIDRYPLPLQQRLIKRTAPLPQTDDKPLDPVREMQQVVLDQRLRTPDIQCINDLYDLHDRMSPFPLRHLLIPAGGPVDCGC